MSDYLDAYPDVVLVGCQFKRIDQDGNFIGNGHRSRWVPGRFLPRQLRKDECETPFVTYFCATGQGTFTLFRRSVFNLTNGYTESFWSHEDSDILCQMALVGPTHYIPDRLYSYRERPGSLTKAGPSSYADFRARWDCYQSSNPITQRTIAKARSHYYRKHRPLRDFKVSAKAFREFVANRQMHSLKWAAECFRNGCLGLIGYK